ncbi:hypothetical protein LBMAG42_26070 [Deltaproteobacteria bacterium]|nr:hypothetical protein LBMAG42_26070 [Deltaproteobacteria bacterium]
MPGSAGSGWSETLTRITAALAGPRAPGAVLTEAAGVLGEQLGEGSFWLADPRHEAPPPGTAGWTQARVAEPVPVALRVAPALVSEVDRPLLQVLVSVVSCALDRATLRGILDPMPIGVLVRRGPHQEVSEANPTLRALGWSADNEGSDLGAGLRFMADRVLAGGGPEVKRGWRVQDPEGSEVYLDVTTQPLHASDGAIDGTATFVVNTTELVRQRRAAETAQQRQGQLLQSIHAIVWEAPAGSPGWTYVSDGAIALLGYPLDRWLEPSFWRTILHEDDRARVVANSGAVRGDHELEYRVFAADGRVVWLHDAVRVITDGDGGSIALRGVMLDITTRKEAEEERNRIQTEMVDLQKLESLGVMAGGIAHDFNNLLTVILGNASLAAMRLPDHSSARSAIDDLISNAQRAADLTRQLLAYSGRTQLSSETLDLGHLVRELRGLMVATLSKSATLEMEIDPLVPAVEGDPTQLQQVVMNLTTNAAESLGERAGRVIVQTSFAALQPEEAAALNLSPGAYVVLSVQDDGCGMSAAVKKRIFDPFFTTKAHGRGLGLAAVHGIVRVHRGAVDVRTKEQVGTVVSVYLPATSVRPTPRPQRTNTIRTGSGLLLVIDDEAEVRATARAMLEALGYDVIEAEEGRSGLLLFDRHRKEIRAVLLDMTMPVMSGEEVYRELRLRDRNVRIVLSTGYSQVDARRRGMLDGIRGFLQKPYTVRQLSDTIGRALEDGATGVE